MRELWQEITAFLSFFISMGTVITVTLPGLRKRIGEWMVKNDESRKEILRIRSLLESHVAEDQIKKEEMKLQQEVDRCVLRDLITGIYYQYAKEKKIPTYALEDVTALYELYLKRGGNSYVRSLVRQITEEWEVIR